MYMSIEDRQQIDVDAFMEQHGIGEDLARREIIAHDQVMTVAEGIASCPPFASQIRATVEALEASIPDEETRETILKNVLVRTIDSMSAQSEGVEVDSDFLGQESGQTVGTQVAES